jgi:hypothetical protein
MCWPVLSRFKLIFRALHEFLTGSLEIDRLQLDSPVLQDLKLRTVDVIQPLASQGELIGLLILGPHLKGEPYTNEERSMLATLAPQVAPALRVAQMVQEQQVQVRERERIEQELQTAQAIQHAFLPKDVPALPGWQLVPYYQPARQVGGDFYDFLPFEDGRLGLVIGDVSGKGVPAALVMATVHTMLRSTVQGWPLRVGSWDGSMTCSLPRFQQGCLSPASLPFLTLKAGCCATLMQGKMCHIDITAIASLNSGPQECHSG